jgi:hypothetical protein
MPTIGKRQSMLKICSEHQHCSENIIKRVSTNDFGLGLFRNSLIYKLGSCIERKRIKAQKAEKHLVQGH